MENYEPNISIETEFSNARQSRAEGNEGRARVCARRAAGLAIGQYYEQCLGETPPASAYQLLQWFSERVEISQSLREAAKRLTVQVTPEYELPHVEDPLEDATYLISEILKADG